MRFSRRWVWGVAACAATCGVMAAAASGASAAWSIQPTPNQPSAKVNQLLGLSCPSTAVCVAVGDYGDGSSSAPLVERFDGHGWSIDPTVAAAGAHAQLAGVSCASSTSCVAVGSRQRGRYFRPIAERWDGARWSLLKVPQPRGALGTDLEGISCTSQRNCVAVGGYGTKTHGRGLIERWNGHRWKVEATLKAPFHGGGSFNAVSCPSGRYC